MPANRWLYPDIYHMGSSALIPGYNRAATGKQPYALALADRGIMALAGFDQPAGMFGATFGSISSAFIALKAWRVPPSSAPISRESCAVGRGPPQVTAN
jgi:hypothetical protein